MEIPFFIKRLRASFSPKYPVYIFHHIPKCGGTSILHLLSNWFYVIRDYREGWSMKYPTAVDLSILNSKFCICGHWEFKGYHLYQRYPEVFDSEKFKIFTFLREPLEVSLSLFRYEKENNINVDMGIEEHLSIRKNYIASIFPLTEKNYNEILDKYFFVGILEEGQCCVDLLAEMIGKNKCIIPWQNKTNTNILADKRTLSKDVIGKFKKENSLDYLIYDCAYSKFNKLKESLQTDVN
ncbi:MAG TPA: hypothetical protein ENH23_00245 [candidate division Zixibacteria bacterium]|nr:hypothetical protein [candidate division Zixibacteria bacterium]